MISLPTHTVDHKRDKRDKRDKRNNRGKKEMLIIKNKNRKGEKDW
jgi:hypothetical protein